MFCQAFETRNGVLVCVSQAAARAAVSSVVSQHLGCVASLCVAQAQVRGMKYKQAGNCALSI